MLTHLYEVGTVVSLQGDGQTIPATSRYVVEAQMPVVGTLLQYRIKGETEAFRRVVVEYRLTAFGTPHGPSPADRRRPGEAD